MHKNIIKVVNDYCKRGLGEKSALSDGEVKELTENFYKYFDKVADCSTDKGAIEEVIKYDTGYISDALDYLEDGRDLQDLYDLIFGPDGDWSPSYWRATDINGVSEIYYFDLDPFRAEASLNGYGLKYERLTWMQRQIRNDLKR